VRGRSNSLEELVVGESGQLERRDPLIHPHPPKGKYHMFEIVSVTNQPQSMWNTVRKAEFSLL
jgi:hypothetical protein